MTETRRGLLEAIAADIVATRTRGEVCRIGVDGVDGAGKTVFADELATVLESDGVAVVRASVDGFHHPPAVRYRRGRNSPVGFFEDSYDYTTLREVLLDPLSPGGSGQFLPAVYDVDREQPLRLAWERAPSDAVLLLDGIFLHRELLRDYWDYSIFLDVDFAIPRGARRGYGDPDPAAAANRRYVHGQQLYLQRCLPRKHATVVVDNTDLAAPAIVRRGRGHDVHRADTDDIEELVGLRDDIARWMHDVGIRTWNPGEIEPADVRRWLDEGTVYVRREADRLVAAVVILWEDPDIWGETDGGVGYIHNLMVARSHTRRGLGEAMLSAAEQHIRRHGADLARLDAAEDSAFLQGWYVDRGYRRVGARRFDRGDVYDTVLYEKNLAAR